MKKRALGFLMAAVMTTSLLAGCGGGGNAANGGKTADSKQTKSEVSVDNTKSNTSSDLGENKELEGDITFWHSFTQGPRLEKIQAAADTFMKEHPKVKITIETFSWADFYTKWTTGLASGNVPDMSSTQASQLVEMIDADAVRPVDDLIDKIGRDRFMGNALTEMTAKDGNCYGVPLYMNTEAMWYRKDLLEKYKLDIPTTWEEMYTAAKTITEGEKGKAYGAAMPMGTNDMLATRWLHLYVRSAGETLITEDGKANLTSKTALDGIRYWVKVFKDCSPADAMNYNTLDEATLYYQGNLCFDFNTGFHINGVEANRPDLMKSIDCAPIPRINKDDKEIGCETNTMPLVVWKNSKHPEVCEEFIKFFYDEDRYVDFLLSVPVGMMSGLKGVTDSKIYKENKIVQDFKHADEVLNQMLGGSTSIGMEYGPRPEAGLLTSQRVIEKMFQDIITNGTDVEKAAKNAEDRLNELFETIE